MSCRRIGRYCFWAVVLGLVLPWVRSGPLHAQPSLPAIVINEIHCDPANPASHEVFVELYNAGTGSVSLAGWTFKEAISYTFPQGTVLAAGGYLVVAEDPTGLRQKAGVACYGPFQGHLKTEGERIALHNASDQVIDEVTYGLGFPWPTATQGRSMELIHPLLDNDLGGSWRVYKYGSTLPQGNGLAGTPGARNSVWATNAPPQIWQVDHAPKPRSNRSIVVTAKVTDPSGIGTVILTYQVVCPGHYIPARLPVPLDVLKANASTARDRNPEFDDAANWSSLQMTDDGTGSDEAALDGVYTAVIPGQPHRTLIRYRITASDASATPFSITVPYQDDEALNFAFWVYDGVPVYVANTSSVLDAPYTYDAATLETLPVYTLVTRSEDLSQCLAYDVANQIPGETVGARRAFNWEGAFVFEGRVYDHVNYRLRGAMGRYDLAGKRDMKIHFNRGGEFQARDRFGRAYALGWRDLNIGKMFDNLASHPDYGQGNFGLTETVNSILWNLMGVPSWDTHWFHFRVVDGEQEAPNQYQGDFWGMFLAVEEYDGRFLQRQGLPDGNLYKLSAYVTDKALEKRNQGRDSVADTSDYANLKAQLVPGKTEVQLRQWLDYDEFYRYLAVAEAVRHYDFPAVWSDENVAFYFEPDATGQNPFGLAWYLPYDTDLTWGPVANDGINEAWQALEPAGVDGKAHTENAGGLTAMKLQFRNTLREFRDLLWNPETLTPLLDDLAASIAEFAQADQDRWTNIPAWASDAGGVPDTFTWSVQDKAEDMRRFAFVGEQTWPGANANGYVPLGGQAAILDQITDQEGDAAAVPYTPTSAYIGPAGFPVDGLTFRASVFSDPQGAGTFGAMQWRIAEVSDANAPDYDPANWRYEIQAVWQSGEITPYASDISIPTTGLQVGHLYRVRVRMKDNTGRWSHWSAPVQFVTGLSLDTSLADGLRITEIMYHPADPPAGDPDAEFIEFQNIGATALQLSGLRITGAVDFTFGAVTLDPGQYSVVVKDQAIFESRYGTGLPINGVFSGSLNNAGESIVLIDVLGQTLLSFSYDPAWYIQTDGEGYSLVTYDPTLAAGEGWSTPEAWQPSNLPGGSPGKDDFGDLPALGSIVINEVLAHSHGDAPDWIELYNTTSRPIALGGWFLSNSAKDLTRYQIPAGTVIGAKRYIVFYENTHFGNPSAPGSKEPFALSEAGDIVYLSSGHNGQLTGYSEYKTFGASETAVSFGLYATSSGVAEFVSLSQPTPGTANAYPKVGPVVINEIMYNPAASNDAEYVELLNVSTAAVNLYEAATQLAWQFTDDPDNPGISLTFTGTSDVVIGAGKYVLLVKDKTVFSTIYGAMVPAGTQIFQWTGGRLNNAGDNLDLTKAIGIDDLTTGWVHVDRVHYSDGSHPVGNDPWPTGADGSGMALARIKSTGYGNDAANWKAVQASPGKANP